MQLVALKANEVSPVQPLKDSFSMFMMELGIVIEVRPVQPENARDPMLVTVLGMVTEVSPVQS